MKKIVIGLIVFALVAMTGSAVAWEIGITIGVEDAKVDITATATDDDYMLAASAGVDGTGDICIQGEGDSDSGYLITSVSGGGELYAAQGLGIAGCLIECTEEPCNECPDYLYMAESGAAINGEGEIILAQATGWETQAGEINGQILAVHGRGNFMAGMLSTLWIEGQDPISHAMGASGQNVEFCAFGIQGIDANAGANAGFFITDMNFNDPGCEGDECPEL